MFQMQQPSSLAQAMQYAMIQRLTADQNEEKMLKLGTQVLQNDALRTMAGTSSTTVLDLTRQIVTLRATGKPEDAALAAMLQEMVESYKDAAKKLMANATG
jgi:uncharacterized protein (DUF2252 family)